MAKTPHKIDITMLEDGLKSVIEYGSTIRPVNTYEDLPATNPDGWVMARILSGSHKNEVHVWDTTLESWQLIGANDPDIAWDDVQLKPATFPPSTHNHDELYFTEIEITNLLAGKANASHTHDDQYFTEAEVTNLLASKANAAHSHDDLYFTETEVTNLLAGKAASVHNHDDMYYTDSEVDALLIGKAAANHNHDGAYYKKTEVDNALTGKADTGHNHNSDYAVKATETTVGGHETRITAIENGYSDGHLHSNLTVLDKLSDNAGTLQYGGADIGGTLNLITATTADLDYYIDAENGDDSNDGLTIETAFKTITHAVSLLPKIICHTVSIYVAEGDYTNEGAIEFLGFINGGGFLSLEGAGALTTLDALNIWDCSVRMLIYDLAFSHTVYIVSNSLYVEVKNCIMTTNDPDGFGIIIGGGSNASIVSCTISNKSIAVVSGLGCGAFIRDTDGLDNYYGYFAAGGIIFYTECTLTAVENLEYISEYGSINPVSALTLSDVIADSHSAFTIGTKIVDETNIANNKLLLYNSTFDSLEYGFTSWNNIQSKPSSFVPQAHKSTHASGGADALVAGDIPITDSGGLFTATDLEGALSELFTSVSNGKTSIATAITDKGGTASGSDTFAELHAAIDAISTGIDTTEATNPITASCVQSGKIGFVNGAKVTGNVPLKTGDCGSASSSTIAGIWDGAVSVNPANGIYNGAWYAQYIDNLTAANIKAGVKVGYSEGGSSKYITGTCEPMPITISAGEVVNCSSFTKTTVRTLTYSEVLHCHIRLSGTYRFTFDLLDDTQTDLWAQVYVNGVARGTERHTYTRTNETFTYTEDFVLKAGDTFQLYGKTGSTSVTVWTLYEKLKSNQSLNLAPYA